MINVCSIFLCRVYSGNKSIGSNQKLLEVLEMRSKFLAESLAHLTGSLRSAMHAVSGMSVSFMEMYEKSLSDYSDVVDKNVETMTDYIERCNQIHSQLEQMKQLHTEMFVFLTCIFLNRTFHPPYYSKDIKKLVDQLDQIQL